MASRLQIPLIQQAKSSASISDHFINGIWQLLDDITLDLKNEISQIQCLKDSADICLWLPSMDGIYSVKAMMSFNSNPMVSWAHFFWKEFLPPSRFFLCWRAYLGFLATEDNLIKKGFQITSRCCFYQAALETVNHLFLNWYFAKEIWTVVGNTF